MKALVLACLVAITGCTMVGTGAGAAAPDFPDTSFSDTTTQSDDMSPRMVEPATGGAPVLATPVGGGVYEPATGGSPIPGTAL